MTIITCIFCYAQMVSDGNKEELEVKYESHLMGWHNIADMEERKLAILRTLGKELQKKNYKTNGEETILTRSLSDKIEKALKTGTSAAEQQFTFENEDYLVRSIVIEDEEPFQEEIASNPDATIVCRDGSFVDEEDIVSDKMDTVLSNDGNIEGKEGDKEDQRQIHSVETPIEVNDLDVDTLDNVNSDSSRELDLIEAPPKEQNIFVDEDHKSDESQESSITTIDGVGDKAGEVFKDCSVIVTKLKKKVIKQMVGPDISVPWYEWGHHVCVECGNVVFLGSMERHLTLHSMSLVEYQEQHRVPEEALSIPLYECLVCGVAIAHSNKKIMAHLQLHNIDMGSYYFHYVQGGGDIIKHELEENMEKDYQGKVDDYVIQQSNKEESRLIISSKLFKRSNKKTKLHISSPSSRKEAVSAFHITDVPSYISEPARSLSALTITDRDTSTPDAPARKRRHSSMEPAGELPWYDSSWHQCLECSKVTTRGKFFTSHVKGEHKMTKKEYLEKNPADKVENVPDWTCGVCSKTICWVARAIVTHLSKAHSMSKEQYAHEYIDSRKDVEEVSEEIVLEGKPEIQRLDSGDDVTVVFDKYCNNNNNC